MATKFMSKEIKTSWFGLKMHEVLVEVQPEFVSELTDCIVDVPECEFDPMIVRGVHPSNGLLYTILRIDE